ncbi:MAG TPA: hypothetical protein EYP85_11590 [Armatimonadetes bacterium]|nr:hypothetical protein [Armatimonadota bacterium]
MFQGNFHRVWAIFLIGAILGWGLTLPRVYGGPLRAGFAKRPITPQAPGQWLAGLGDPEDQRRAEGVHDDIYCRVMALSDGTTTIALACLDLIGLFHHDCLDLRSRVRGLPPENVIIACTHLHSGPDTLGLWGPSHTESGVDPQYLAYVKEQAAAAINEAVANLTPAVLRFARTESPPKTSINVNDVDIIDREVAIMQAVTPEGKVLGTLVNWTCHPEVLWTDNRLITSDFVGYLCAEVEQAQGGVAVFFNGPLGGMVTADNEGQHTFAEAERIGRAVGAAVNAALAQPETVEKATIRLARRVFQIELDNPGLEQLWQVGVIKRGPDEGPEAVTTEVYALRIGPAVFITMPGEVLPALGFLIKTLMDAKYKFFFCLAMDELGYLLPETAVGLEKYAYEQSMSVNPRCAPLLIEQARKVLRQVQGE